MWSIKYIICVRTTANPLRSLIVECRDPAVPTLIELVWSASSDSESRRAHQELRGQTVNAIETERYDPSLPLAFKVAELFERTIEDIFEA